MVMNIFESQAANYTQGVSSAALRAGQSFQALQATLKATNAVQYSSFAPIPKLMAQAKNALFIHGWRNTT